MSLPLGHLIRGRSACGAESAWARPMTWDMFTDSLPELLVAALGTLRMTALAFLFAAVLGLAIAHSAPRRRPTGRRRLLYVEIVRGMPALTLLFLIYFGLASRGHRAEFVRCRGRRRSA